MMAYCIQRVIVVNTALTRVPVTPKKEDWRFNFNLQKMKEVVEAPSYELPKNLTFTEFESWMQIHQPKASQHN